MVKSSTSHGRSGSGESEVPDMSTNENSKLVTHGQNLVFGDHLPCVRVMLLHLENRTAEATGRDVIIHS